MAGNFVHHIQAMNCQPVLWDCTGKGVSQSIALRAFHLMECYECAGACASRAGS